MEFIRSLKDNTVLVIPSSLKVKVLEKLNALDYLINVKLMSKEELMSKIYFDYEMDAIVYLMENYHIKLDVAKTYLENMYFLTSGNTSSDKLNELYKIKTEMFDLGLLKKNPLFPMLLKNRNVIFYGYDFYKQEDLRLIDEVKKYTNVEIINKPVNSSKDLEVLVFEKMDDEVEYVINKMLCLHEQGVAWNKIKIIGLDDTYKNIFSMFLNFFSVPISVNTSVSLYETLIGKKILDLIKKDYSFSNILEELADELGDIKDKVLAIFNKYQKYISKKDVVYSLIESEFKKTYLEEDKLTEEIKQSSISNFYCDFDDYVFVIGFTNGRFPIVKKDEDYISNELKKELGLSTSLEENEMVKNSLMNTLFGIKNLEITYSKSDYFNEYYPSTLINDYNMEEVEIDKSLVHYSKTWDKIKLAKMLDDYLKFGIKHKDLEKFYSSLDINYLTYDNRYKKIDSFSLRNVLNNKLLLSYSTLDTFYRCNFRYYIQNILRLNKFEETSSIRLGNTFHTVLSRMYENDFDFDRVWSEETKKYELSKKEEFYFEKWKKELQFIIDTILEQDKIMGFHPASFEEKFFVKEDIIKDMDVTFMGVIDKILSFSKGNKNLVSIVDYKTGSADIDLSYAPFGLKLQLPSYVYLLKHSKNWCDSTICGIYLQKFLSSTSLDKKKDSLKLRGYSTSNESLLEIFDPTYEDSELVKSLKKTKSGWYRYTKLLDEVEMDDLVNLVKEKITFASREILDSNFSINPKRIDGENVGCEFCTFKDICFRREKDIINIERGEGE